MIFAKTVFGLAVLLGAGLWQTTNGASIAKLKLAQADTQCIEPDALTGSSTAVVVDDVPLAHTTQILPLDETGKLVGKGQVSLQADQVLANLARVLAAANSQLASTVKLNVYLANAEAMPAVQKALSQIRASSRPAVSFVVGSLPHTDALVAMDAVAIGQSSPSATALKKPGSMYEQMGIQHCRILPAGPKVYVSGMADTNSLPEATRKTLEKLAACIGNLGLKKADIVQLKAFLQPMSEVGTVRQQIVSFFDGAAPPVSFVEWISPAPNPPIEIELIAAGAGDFSKEPEPVSFLTPPGTTSTKVFSRLARVNHGKLIYICGLYGLKANDADGEVSEIFGSLGEVLKKTGSNFENLAKATYYVSDSATSDKLNEIRPRFFNPQRPPAASKAMVKGVGLAGKRVTIDMIAVGN
jgi:enamine deaminase RidA (YjgF/YER057c/UK114 family)